MPGRRFPWKWALFASVGLLVAGTATVALAGSSPLLQKLGWGAFIAAGVVYVVARVAMLREDRFR